MRTKIWLLLVLAIATLLLINESLAEGRDHRGGSEGKSSSEGGRSSESGVDRSGSSRGFSAPSRDSSPAVRGLPDFSSRSRGGGTRSLPNLGESASQRRQLSSPRSGASRASELRGSTPRVSEPPISSPRITLPNEIQSRIVQPRDNETRSKASRLSSPRGGESRSGDSRLAQPKITLPRDDGAAQAIRDAQSVPSTTGTDRRQQLGNQVRLPNGRASDAARQQLDRLGIRTSDTPATTDEGNGAKKIRPPRDLILGGDRTGPNIGGDSGKLGDIQPKPAEDLVLPNVGDRQGSEATSPVDKIRVPGSSRPRPQRPILENPVVTDDTGAQGLRDKVRIPGGHDSTKKIGDLVGPQTGIKKPLSQRPIIDEATAARLGKQNWLERADRARVDQLAGISNLQRIRLQDQYRLHHHGDVGRQLNLHQTLISAGGWGHRHVGIVSPWYRNTAFYRSYCGPGWFPQNCWYPLWRPWVSWSWHFHCQPWFDPRPVYCRPVFFDPCPAWVWWQYPVWQPLPVVTCGTWVNVPLVAVQQGWDVQLLAVRFVDPGFAEKDMGPRYRVWIRNNSNRAIDQPFDVVVMGANERQVGDRRVETGQRVTSLDAGETIALDMRLPLTIGNAPFDFSLLHVLVDAGRLLNDIDLTNNGTVIERREILPVDPAVFDAENPVVEAGSVINMAGEGLGPEPGQVVLHAGGRTYQPEILGWYDLGLRVRLPEIPAAEMTEADLVVIRGDGAAANPLNLQVVPRAAGQAF